MLCANAGERLLSNEFPGSEKRDGGFFPVRRNDGEFCAARPKIEDCISRISLRKEGLFGLRPNPAFSRKVARSNSIVFASNEVHSPSRIRASREQFGRNAAAISAITIPVIARMAGTFLKDQRPT